MNSLFGRFMRKNSAAALAEEDDGNRRGHNRHAVSTEVIVKVDSESYNCVLRDVGPGGAFLSPSFDVDVGRDVTLHLPNSKICATAGVQRVELTGIGVKFDDDTIGAIVAGWSKGLID